MTDEQIAEALALAQKVRELADAATPGPCTVMQVDVEGDDWMVLSPHSGFPVACCTLRPNADLIASYRDATPALAEAVQSLAAERDELRAEIARLKPLCHLRSPESTRTSRITDDTYAEARQRYIASVHDAASRVRGDQPCH